MTATTNYQAGVESTFAQLGYMQEAAYGVPPTGAYKRLRFTSETLTGNKARQRTGEINGTREAAEAVTTEESASGALNFGLSYGAYDDILSAILGGEWATNVLKPGLVFKSFTVEKRFSPTLFLRYPGLFFTGANLTMARGQFLSMSCNAIAKEEKNFATSLSTGGNYTAATTGRIMDPVGGVRDIQLNGAAIAAVVNSINLSISNDGAAADYGLGSAAAQGMRMGTLTVGGRIEMYFRDFVMYERFKSEARGALSWKTIDADGNAYQWAISQAGIMNPSITAGGVNQPVMASFDLEGNPDEANGTISITRIPVAPGP
jgi:hypothetical protein